RKAQNRRITCLVHTTTIRLQPNRATTLDAEPTLCCRGSNAKPRYLWNRQVQLRSLPKKILRCTSARSADEALARVRRSRLAHAPKARVARTEWSAKARADYLSTPQTLQIEPDAFPFVARPNRYSPPADRARSRIPHPREIG